ncbi:MAG: hypothetical protein AB3N11_17945 [Arenibacterium sp.]
MILVFLLTAIAIASITAFVALLTGATLLGALWLYVVTGMATLLGLPLLLKSYEVAVTLLGYARANTKGEQELRLIEYQGNSST